MRRITRYGIVWLLLLVCGLLACKALADDMSTASQAVVDVSVTRKTSATTSTTLPAALVPELRSGDVIRFGFPAYSKPYASWKWHADVAFITSAPPTTWLFSGNDRATDLFADRGRSARRAPFPPIVYDERQGVPIFFLVPEDKKTRGMDGVRSYVAANGTSFLTMAQSSNDAQAQRTWFESFMEGLASGAIAPSDASASSVSSAASQLGGNPADIDACYRQNANIADPAAKRSAIVACIEGIMQPLAGGASPPASSAEAAFFGVPIAHLVTSAYTPILGALLTVWQLFHHVGHEQYEYVPSVLSYEPPASGGSVGAEFLRSAVVPQLRGAGGTISDALFFTIGGSNRSTDRPTIAFDDAGGGVKFGAVCATGDRVIVPFRLTRTAQYVHDAMVLITGRDGKTRELPVDSQSLGEPILPIFADGARSGLDDGSGPRYHVRMTAKFGFDDVATAQTSAIDAVVPHPGAWNVSAEDRSHVDGASLINVTLRSDSVPCFASASLSQNGTSFPLPAIEKDATHEIVSIDASRFQQGKATLTIHQQSDASGRNEIADTVTININPAPPVPAANFMPVAYRRDTAAALTGSRLDEASSLTLNGIRFPLVAAASNATFACFSAGAGTQLNVPTNEQTLNATLNTNGPWPPLQFPIRLLPPRPSIVVDGEHVIGQDEFLQAPAPPALLSTQVLDMTLRAESSDAQAFTVRVRRHPPNASPCDVFRDNAGELTLPASSISRNANTIDAVFEPETLFNDAASGRFDLQVIDTATGARSDWITIPGTVIRAPQIDAVTCGAADTTCRITGKSLLHIEAVSDGQTPLVPIATCPGLPLGSCLIVPRFAHYAVRLKGMDAALSIADAARK